MKYIHKICSLAHNHLGRVLKAVSPLKTKPMPSSFLYPQLRT